MLQSTCFRDCISMSFAFTSFFSAQMTLKSLKQNFGNKKQKRNWTRKNIRKRPPASCCSKHPCWRLFFSSPLYAFNPWASSPLTLRETTTPLQLNSLVLPLFSGGKKSGGQLEKAFMGLLSCFRVCFKSYNRPTRVAQHRCLSNREYATHTHRVGVCISSIPAGVYTRVFENGERSKLSYQQKKKNGGLVERESVWRFKNRHAADAAGQHIYTASVYALKNVSPSPSFFHITQ